MRIMSIIAHPRPDSFCHAISERIRASLAVDGHEVFHHDLYREGFDPCLKAEEAYSVGDTLETTLARSRDRTVRTHREVIGSVQGLLIVHPNWWGKPPAILAGWIDRVLVPGVAYRLETADGLPEGLLSIDSAVVINTSDTPEKREMEELGDPLEAMWGRCVLPYCGVQSFHRQIFRPVVDSSIEERGEWLATADEIGRNAFSRELSTSCVPE